MLQRKFLNYSSSGHSMFLHAYRAYIEALATKDNKTLRKMSERNLYKAIIRDQRKFDELGYQYI